MDTHSVKSIVRKIGRAHLADALGLSVKSVSAAITDGMFPSSWEKVVIAACKIQGIECPDGLFSFKPVPDELQEDAA